MLNLTVIGKQQEGLDITWSITDVCNYNCPYCLVPKGNYFSNGDIIQELNKYKDKIRTLILFGGEPTLHPNLLDFLKQIQISDIRVWTNFSAPVELYQEILKYARLNITFHKNIKPFYNKLKLLPLDNIVCYAPVSHNHSTQDFNTLNSLIKVITIPIVGIDNYYKEQPNINEDIEINVTGDINKKYDNTSFNEINFQPYLVSCNRNMFTLDIIHDIFQICGHKFKSLQEAISKPIMCRNKCNVCFYHIGTKKGLFIENK